MDQQSLTAKSRTQCPRQLARKWARRLASSSTSRPQSTKPAGNSSVTRRALPSRLRLPRPLSSYEEAPAEDTSYLTVELVPLGARRGSAGCIRLDDHQPF